MPVPMGAMQQQPIFIMAAAAPAATSPAHSGTPDQAHREPTGSPADRDRSPTPSDHSDATPPSHHEHLTEAIEGVLDTMLSKRTSHHDEGHGDGDSDGHDKHDRSHVKTGLAVAAGSHLLKRSLQKSAKVRRPPQRLRS